MTWKIQNGSASVLAKKKEKQMTSEMNQRIENYLAKYEDAIINGEWKLVETASDWVERFESAAGVYAVREEGEICYVGESGNLRKRMRDLLDTRNHSLRRIIGSVKFVGQEGYEKSSPSRKFPPKFEEELDQIFEDNFEVSAVALPLGRKELEERLIEKYKPRYNARGKRKPREGEKAYSVAEIRKSHVKAYQPWTAEDDDELERLAKEGKPIDELASIFGRNRGAITSRLKKIKKKIEKSNTQPRITVGCYQDNRARHGRKPHAIREILNGQAPNIGYALSLRWGFGRLHSLA